CSYIRVAQHSCFLRANHPAEFMAAVLANGGGFYHPFAYVAEAMRMGLTVRPPDVNASRYRTSGRGREVRIGFQFIKGLSQEAVEELETGGAYTSFDDFRRRTTLRHDDLRLLIQVGACDSIAGGMTRPMLLWQVDAEANAARGTRHAEPGTELWKPVDPPPPPLLREYDESRRRRTEYELLGFTTDSHPMDLFRDELARLRVTRSTDLARQVGKTVLCAGMLTTAKPVHTAKDEPMEFATFDDGAGLIEAVLFPDVYRARGHVLFDQGPFLLRGKVEEEFGAVTLTVTGIDRLERALVRSDTEAGTATERTQRRRERRGPERAP
ncbi:MAG TPA: hypothetical protein VG692_12665, partial [Gemmatimonadales bacterium]|nr:hypothetical protein [Gemmatimonadales bacterium]